LRSSIIPGLLKAIAKNPSFDPVLIFEVADVFNKKSEESKLAVAASGKGSKESIETVKNELDNIISGLKIDIHEIGRDELCRFKIRKPVTYVFEILLSDISKEMKLKNSELKLKVSNNAVIYRPISKYPSLTRDIAFILDKKVKSNDIKQTIYEVSKLINRVELFDEFASNKFGKNKKNIAFHIYFQLPDRTMKDKEADELVIQTISTVEKKYSARLRK
jgi:phenylalanyl-tRNA synthetase beta chain